MEGSYKGKQASVIDYGARGDPAGRNALVNVQGSFPYQRRWVSPVDELVQRIDTFDKLRTIEDPTSALVRGTSAAIAREWDDRVIAAAFGPAQISSNDGTTLTTETWATAQTNLTGSATGLTIIDTFGNSSTTIGMTVDKLIEAQRLFESTTSPSLKWRPAS